MLLSRDSEVAEGEHTAGLNSPPLIRKKTQTLTAKENPKARDMYSNVAVLAGLSNPLGGVLAT